MQDYFQIDVIPTGLFWLTRDRRRSVLIEEGNSVTRNEHVDLWCLAVLMPLGLVDTMAMHHPQMRKWTCKGCLKLCSMLLSPNLLARASCVHPS